VRLEKVRRQGVAEAAEAAEAAEMLEGGVWLLGERAGIL